MVTETNTKRLNVRDAKGGEPESHRASFRVEVFGSEKAELLHSVAELIQILESDAEVPSDVVPNPDCGTTEASPSIKTSPPTVVRSDSGDTTEEEDSDGESEDGYECKHCGKTFETRYHLGGHVVQNHTERDEEPCVCEGCGRGFDNPQQRGGHKPHCTGEPPEAEVVQKPMSGPEPEPSESREMDVSTRDFGEIGRKDVHDDIWLDENEVVWYHYRGKDEALETSRVNYRVMYLAAILHQRHGEGFTTRDLSDEFGGRMTTVSPAFTVLRGLGIVERTSENRDEMEYRVTEAGWKYIDFHGPPTEPNVVDESLVEELEIPEEYRYDD